MLNHKTKMIKSTKRKNSEFEFLARSPNSHLRSKLQQLLLASLIIALLAILGVDIIKPSKASAPIGPVTNLHYTANSNFDGSGNYLPGADNFNMADVENPSELADLPSGVKALVWIGQCGGVNSTFTSAVQPYIGNSSVYGFYVMDEPDPTGLYSTLCPPANLKAESDWIHANDPGTKTFIILMNLSSSKTPSFSGSYTPANSDIDLFGIDPYPCRQELGGCDYQMITNYINAAESFGIPAADIVPVYQGFGGGGWIDDGGQSYLLPTASEEDSILSTWKTSIPSPAFDYVYSWGVQNSDESLSGSSALQQVFATENAPIGSSGSSNPSSGGSSTTSNGSSSKVTPKSTTITTAPKTTSAVNTPSISAQATTNQTNNKETAGTISEEAAGTVVNRPIAKKTTTNKVLRYTATAVVAAVVTKVIVVAGSLVWYFSHSKTRFIRSKNKT